MIPNARRPDDDGPPPDRPTDLPPIEDTGRYSWAAEEDAVLEKLARLTGLPGATPWGAAATLFRRRPADGRRGWLAELIARYRTSSSSRRFR